MSWIYSFQNDKLKYTPIINCKREELKYRFDIDHHLNKFGLNEKFRNQNIWFVDDLPNIDMTKVESVGLIDFNKLNKELEQYNFIDKIHYIIDNHYDHQKYSNSLKEKQ